MNYFGGQFAVLTLLAALLCQPVPAAAETSAISDIDARFAALRLASVPLPGSSDELVVDEEQALEVFLSPSDFPDALVRLSLTGAAADFAVNLDFSSLRGEALPARVEWPGLGGRPLEVAVAGGESVQLAPPANRQEPPADDAELRIEWYLRPLVSEPPGPHRSQVAAVRLATSGDEDRTLATWIADPPAEGCSDRVSAGAPRCRVSGVSETVRSLAVDPSGRWVAVAGGDLRPRVDLWQIAARFALSRRMAFPPWLGPPLGADFTADGRLLVVVDAGGAIHLWNAASGGEHRRVDVDGRAFAVLGSGQLVAVAEREGGLTIWRVRDGTISVRLGPRQGAPTTQLAASADGLRVAALALDEGRTTVAIWQLEEGRVVGRIGAPGAGIVDLALLGPGEHAAATHDERGLLRAPVRLSASWAAWGGEVGRRCRGELAQSPDHQTLACVLDRGAALFDAATGRHLRTIGAAGDGEGPVVDRIVFSPDGSRLLATGGGELFAWPLSQQAEGGRRR